MAGVTLAGFGVAGAQDGDDPSARPEGSIDGRPHGGMLRRFAGGPGHPGRGAGLGNMLHGEGVVRRGEGEGVLETVAMQSGKVTAVSDGSIEVESSDGFTRKYAVGDDTHVAPRGNDIGDVDEGDEVRVFAVVDGDGASAKRIADITDMPDRPHGPLGQVDGAPEGAPEPDAAA